MLEASRTVSFIAIYRPYPECFVKRDGFQTRIPTRNRVVIDFDGQPRKTRFRWGKNRNRFARDALKLFDLKLSPSPSQTFDYSPVSGRTVFKLTYDFGRRRRSLGQKRVFLWIPFMCHRNVRMLVHAQILYRQFDEHR